MRGNFSQALAYLCHFLISFVWAFIFSVECFAIATFENMKFFAEVLENLSLSFSQGLADTAHFFGRLAKVCAAVLAAVQNKLQVELVPSFLREELF